MGINVVVTDSTEGIYVEVSNHCDNIGTWPPAEAGGQ